MIGLRSRAARAAFAILTIAATSAVGVPTAAAAPPDPVVYDALGDSYGSGYGVPPYSACGRSDAAYAVQVDGRKRIALDDFVACAGATTLSLVAGGQLDALDANTHLVTISIGGNDTGWSTAVVACLASTDQNCQAAREMVTSKITTVLPGLLDSLYAQVAAAAPNAHVVITGYPRLFSPEEGAFLGASVTEQEGLNDGADLLNSVMADAATAHGFQFVDVTERFIDHGVNSPDAWILGPLDPGAFHPDAQGYQAYTAAVTSALKPPLLG